MDLEEFENAWGARTQRLQSHYTAEEALNHLDAEWYVPTSRKTRWMDLLGDYAGSEPFIVEGDSMLQLILDDPLLLLGRINDPGFQILHAVHSLERTLKEFSRRSAVFDIVFWEDNRHLTIHTGDDPYVVASRSLARRLLLLHLDKLMLLDKISVYHFSNLSDPRWLEYERRMKPMFVMMNDGGLLEQPDKLIPERIPERILCQRVFFFNLLSSGISVALLQGAKFQDSRISSFVYESRRNVNSHRILPRPVFQAYEDGLRNLNDCELSDRPFTWTRPFLGHGKKAGQEPCPESLLSVVTDISRLYTSSKIGKIDSDLFFAFILHCIILGHLSVEERAINLKPIHPTLLSAVLEALTSIFFAVEIVATETNTFIDLDGRVFVALLQFLMENKDTSLHLIIGDSLFDSAQAVLSALRRDRPRFPELGPATMPLPSVSSDKLSLAPYELLLFSNPVFDAELASVHVAVQAHEENVIDYHINGQRFSRGVVFSDDHHWHDFRRSILPKHLGGEEGKITDARELRRKLRSDQFFMVHLQRQAITLTGALGTALKQLVIVPVGSETQNSRRAIRDKEPAQKQKEPVQKQKRDEKKKLSKADQIRQQNMNDKKRKEDKDSSQWWQDRLKEMSTLSVDAQIDYLLDLARNPRTKDGPIAAEIQLYNVHLSLSKWKEASDVDSTRDKCTVEIIRVARTLCTSKHLTLQIKECLVSVFVALGFGSLVDTIGKGSETLEDRPLNFKFIKLIKSKSKQPLYEYMAIQEHPVVWQLRVFGDFMERSMGGQPDPRVEFIPDAWQREVLDHIDQDFSLLVVAPTSAGKTFISYYAMEKVLRQSDDGVLVYVAPTKALVSQIAAEVYARFNKNLRDGSCWAIHTRDYRVHDPQKCQILVTVPEMLSIMLLSPPLAKTWTPRIKRIILDEIHTIGQQEGGLVWEQIILLAPCPIIGLSATIGSPEIFNRWLQSVQNAHGFTHKFVHHPHRYSHLRKHFYALQQPASSDFKGLQLYKTTSRMKFLHPMSMLSFGMRSLPSDLSLEAADTLSLYNALKSCHSLFPPTLRDLDPCSFFPHAEFLQQKDVIAYEKALKDFLSPWLSSFDSTTSSPLMQVIKKLEDPTLAALGSQVLCSMPDRSVFRSNLIRLVSDLHVQGDLPAIFFSFDRSDCEIMAQDLLATLETQEEVWRQSNMEWKGKVAEWEAWVAGAKARERMADKVRKQKKGDDEDNVRDEPEQSWQASFDPKDPSSPFTFAGQKTSYSKSDLNEDVNDLSRRSSAPQWAIRCLKRGIAVHHSGMNRRYRTLVESLFRLGFVRVIIATGTLALGINAPAKTSVFCGDSPFLTALMYRQCAGRAGRRGYDLLGKVVFYGLPMDRVERLILSRLPSITGHFPLTSTLCLRLFNLLEGSQYAPVAVNAVQRLLRLPQTSVASEAGKQQVLHHLRFSIDYLRRAHLLDSEGKPLNLFGIAAHLYYTERTGSNLATVALLRSGVLHEICNRPSMIDAKQHFILLMCHLFGRRYLPHSYSTDENRILLIKKSPSKVVLPPLPTAAREVLSAQNEETLRIFAGYARTYAAQHQSELGPDHQLPLSKNTFSGNETDDSRNSLFRVHLQQSAIPVITRSTFMANSGHGDDFHSVSELTRTAREGLHLSEHAIPSFDEILGLSERGDNPFALNAYLLDFYTHGQVAALVTANGIRRGDIWHLLQDFQLALVTIVGVLEHLMLGSSQESASDPSEELFASPSEVTAEDRDEPGDDTEDGDSKIPVTETDGSHIQRPRGLPDEDWRVYKVVKEATNEFDEKYRAMWA